MLTNNEDQNISPQIKSKINPHHYYRHQEEGMGSQLWGQGVPETLVPSGGQVKQ